MCLFGWLVWCAVYLMWFFFCLFLGKLPADIIGWLVSLFYFYVQCLVLSIIYSQCGELGNFSLRLRNMVGLFIAFWGRTSGPRWVVLLSYKIHTAREICFRPHVLYFTDTIDTGNNVFSPKSFCSYRKVVCTLSDTLEHYCWRFQVLICKKKQFFSVIHSKITHRFDLTKWIMGLIHLSLIHRHLMEVVIYCLALLVHHIYSTNILAVITIYLDAFLQPK